MWFFVIVVLLAFAFFFLVLNKTWDSVKTPLGEGLSSAMPSNSPVNVTNTIGQVTSAGFMFDKLIPFIIIGLFAFVMITAGTIIKHPIMIIVGVIILAIVILVAVIYSNAYNSISSTAEFSSIKSQMTIQDKFMQWLPMVVFLMAIGITAGIWWSKSQGGSTSI
jgi:hypothetical protein